MNYKGISGVNVSEAVKLTGYPSISWVSDYFSSWVAQNSNLINLSLDRSEFNYELGQWKTIFGGASSALGGVGSGIQGNVLGGLGAMASIGSTAIDYYSAPYNHEYDVKEQMLQIEKQAMLPNSASIGTNAGILGYGYQNNDVFTRYTIKRQFAERIDLYFDMYGYQTNKLKIRSILKK